MDTEKASTGKFFVPSIVVAYFSTWIIESLTGIFLIDITATFFGNTNLIFIATASQLVTISSIVSVISGLFLGILSVRFSHRKLLIIGVLCVALGTLGCFFAPSFVFMQIFYPLEGIGTVTVGAMAFALVGDSLTLNKRPKATGWILAGGPIASIAAAFAISLFFSSTGDWRSFLLWFALPIAVIALMSASLGIPKASGNSKPTEKKDYLGSYKQVFLKKSAIGCLVGNMVRQAALAWAVVYIATFFRDKFGLPLAVAALVVLVGTALSGSGDIVGGHLVGKVGRKRLLIATLLISSPFLAMIAFLQNFLVVLAINFCGTFIFSMGFPGSVNLTLEQAPRSRGTMMSISTIFVTLGLGIGTAVGGATIAFFGDYTSVILVFVALQLAAATIYYFFTKDPCR